MHTPVLIILLCSLHFFSVCQEEELEDLHMRNMEMESLLIEQQKTLEMLVTNTLAEVAQRESIYMEVRAEKETKIEKLEVRVQGAYLLITII